MRSLASVSGHQCSSWLKRPVSPCPLQRAGSHIPMRHRRADRGLWGTSAGSKQSRPLSQSLWAAPRTEQAGDFEPDKHLAQFGRRGHPRSRCLQIWCPVRARFPVTARQAVSPVEEGAGSSPRPLLGRHLPAFVGLMTTTFQHHTPSTIAVGLDLCTFPAAARVQAHTRLLGDSSASRCRQSWAASVGVRGSKKAGVCRTLQCSPSAGSLSRPVQGPWKEDASAPRVGRAAPKEGSWPSPQPSAIFTSGGKQGSLAFFSFRSGHSVLSVQSWAHRRQRRANYAKFRNTYTSNLWRMWNGIWFPVDLQAAN